MHKNIGDFDGQQKIFTFAPNIFSLAFQRTKNKMLDDELNLVCDYFVPKCGASAAATKPINL